MTVIGDFHQLFRRQLLGTQWDWPFWPISIAIPEYDATRDCPDWMGREHFGKGWQSVASSDTEKLNIKRTLEPSSKNLMVN